MSALSLSFPLKSTIISAALLTLAASNQPAKESKESEKTVAILGDRHCYFEIENLEREDLKNDKSHKQLILELLKKMAGDSQKTAVLIESHPDNPIAYQDIHDKTAQSGYCGIFVDLPAIAHKKKYQDNNLSFIPFDLRSLTFCKPVQFIQNIEDVISGGWHNRYTLSTISSPELNTKLPFFKKILLSKTTIKEYRDSLTTVVAQTQKTTKADQIADLAQQAHTLLEKYKQTSLIDAVFFEKTTTDLPGFHQLMSTLFCPLSSLIGHASLEACMQNNLSLFDKILIITGQSHYVDACELLQKQGGFSLALLEGPQEQLHNVHPLAIPAGENKRLETIMNALYQAKINRQLECPSADAHGQTLCFACHENAGSMQCGRCKKAKYCSVECQKADWKTHKAQCNK